MVKFWKIAKGVIALFFSPQNWALAARALREDRDK
jgi:hypothetical protein